MSYPKDKSTTSYAWVNGVGSSNPDFFILWLNLLNKCGSFLATFYSITPIIIDGSFCPILKNIMESTIYLTTRIDILNKIPNNRSSTSLNYPNIHPHLLAFDSGTPPKCWLNQRGKKNIVSNTPDLHVFSSFPKNNLSRPQELRWKDPQAAPARPHLLDFSRDRGRNPLNSVGISWEDVTKNPRY